MWGCPERCDGGHPDKCDAHHGASSTEEPAITISTPAAVGDRATQRNHDVILAVDGLTVRYGRAVTALRDIHLQIIAGEVVAVLGANGAGKSTLLRALCGTLPLHRGAIVSGEVLLDGRPIGGRPASDIVRNGLAAVPEGRQVFARMTVDENLRAGGVAATDNAARQAAKQRVLDLFPVLADRAHQAAGLLSGGEQQMLAIGRALMGGPRVLLLDEPSLGLAPKMITRIGEIVEDINRQGTTVVLVEQNASMALGVASHAVVLESGRYALGGPAQELATNEDVKRLYLGGHAEPVVHGDSQVRGGEAAGRRVLSRWEA